MAVAELEQAVPADQAAAAQGMLLHLLAELEILQVLLHLRDKTEAVVLVLLRKHNMQAAAAVQLAWAEMQMLALAVEPAVLVQHLHSLAHQ